MPSLWLSDLALCSRPELFALWGAAPRLLIIVLLLFVRFFIPGAYYSPGSLGRVLQGEGRKSISSEPTGECRGPLLFYGQHPPSGTLDCSRA